MVQGGLQNGLRTTQHARRRCANLDKVVSNRFTRGGAFRSSERRVQASGVPIEHGVEGRDLIHTHGGHFKKLCDIIHDANASKSLVLSLPEIE